jgi:hypothetical protein
VYDYENGCAYENGQRPRQHTDWRKVTVMHWSYHPQDKQGDAASSDYGRGPKTFW